MARTQKGIKGFLIFLFILFTFFGIIFITRGNYTINMSPSMELGIYKLYEIDSLEKGDIVYTEIPPDIKKILLERGYIFTENINHFIKRIAAIPKDEVKIESNYVLINSNLYPMSYIKEIDSEGNLLESKLKDGAIIENEYLLLGDTLDSYDSRYWGAIEKKYILKKAKKIF